MYDFLEAKIQQNPMFVKGFVKFFYSWKPIYYDFNLTIRIRIVKF